MVFISAHPLSGYVDNSFAPSFRPDPDLQRFKIVAYFIFVRPKNKLASEPSVRLSDRNRSEIPILLLSGR